MSQSAAIVSTQTSPGTENSARFASQATKRGGSGDRSGVSSGAVPGQTAVLTPAEQQLVQQLKQTDRKVRDHEQAHLAVGADLVRSGPSYTYQTGPDKQRYAVSGEVSIDVSPGRTPEETIPKAQHIRATALAPADPSPQDRSVAATASRMEGEARIELAVQQQVETKNPGQGNADSYKNGDSNGSTRGRIGGRLDLFA